MLKPSRARRRSWITLLACAGLLATSGVAHADSASLSAGRADAFGTPGQTVEVDAPLFHLDFAGTRHLSAGGSFQTTLNPGGSPYVAYDPQTWTLPDTWPTPSRFSFRPKLRVTLPETLGRVDQFVTLTAATDVCSAGLGHCITSSSPLTVMVRMETKPRPVSNVTAAGDNTAIDLRWAHSPDSAQITNYYVDRFDRTAGTGGLPIVLGPDKSSYRDTAAQPGHEYCYRIKAHWESGFDFNQSDPSSLVCAYLNRAPGAPGAPSASPDLTRGPTTVSWSPASEPDGNSVTYTLQHQDANDGDNWSTIWQGFASTQLPVVEQGGTWRYRVRATDQHGVDGPWSEIGPEHKADTTGPGVPKLSYDKTPAPGNWFKDSVTVSFSDAVDSLLPDGSPGGGVGPEGYPAPILLDTHGEHKVAEQAVDRVGNGGAIVPTWVNVDTKLPLVSFDECPDEVLQNHPQQIGWTANDEDGSGLEGSNVGTVDLEADTLGEQTARVTVRDRVGHEATAECTYTVYTNTAPPVVEDLSVSEPNSPDGDFEISWDAAIDPDGDDVDYTIEAVGSPGPVIENLEATSYSLHGVPEGTHTYRVKAFDRPRRWQEGEATVSMKVDKGPPSAPVAKTDRPAESDGWFKDRVTVSFDGSTDPDLADGTDGSGVASYSSAQELTSSGTARGTATDRAGNESQETMHDVKVDAVEPKLELEGCPASRVLLDADVRLSYTATDGDSGFAGGADESGEVRLVTTSVGPQSRTITVSDKVGHATSKTCEYTVYRNSPPPTPDAPSVPAGDRRDGTFGVVWGDVNDVDPEDTVAYAAQQRDANDGDNWADIPGRVSVSELAANVGEGTWQFRVQAIDSQQAESGWSEPSATIKVDRSGPTAPEATADRAAEHDGWFKDRVTVSFGGSTDPDLQDGSGGTGVASYTAPKVLTASGAASGRAMDRVGNPSEDGTLAVKVDNTDPTATTGTCPSPLTVGQPANMTWSASDPQSGVRESTGTVALDTSTPGTRTATGPAPEDNVGHTGTAPTCPYSVAYKFVGFLSPINGDAVNVGKTGRTYPVKWRLQRHDGSLISDAQAQALVPAMYAGQKQSDCSFGLSETDTLEESSTGATELRYDSGADQFIYNYKAPTTPGCYVLGIRSADGANTKQVNFKFTK